MDVTLSSVSWCVFFFFQAEDGIRDYKVTGVQTCALPIFIASGRGALQLTRIARKSVIVNASRRGALERREACKSLRVRCDCGERLRMRSEEHTSELQSPCNLVCRLLLEKKKIILKSWNTV